MYVCVSVCVCENVYLCVFIRTYASIYTHHTLHTTHYTLHTIQCIPRTTHYTTLTTAERCMQRAALHYQRATRQKSRSEGTIVCMRLCACERERGKVCMCMCSKIVECGLCLCVCMCGMFLKCGLSVSVSICEYVGVCVC
jgi:hypothetical protein